MLTLHFLPRLLGACAGVATLAFATSASALAQRTFVASTGDDLAPCSRAQPCRSFGRAIMQTAPNGEVIVIDSAGYGAVMIDKSVSIIAPPGIYAGISVFSGSGVEIDAAGARVVLRGLSINGQGGSYGIRFVQGSELHIDRCVVTANTTGILAFGPGHMTMSDSSLVGNGTGLIVGVGLEASVHNSRIEAQTGTGMVVRTGARARASRLTVSGNDGNGINVTSSDVPPTEFALESSTVVNNGVDGIYVQAINSSAEARVAVARSTLAKNSASLLESGAHLYSAFAGVARAAFSDVQIEGNGQGILFEQHTLGFIRGFVAGNNVAYQNKGIEIDADNAGNVSVLSLGDNVVRRNGQDIIGTVTVVSGN